MKEEGMEGERRKSKEKAETGVCVMEDGREWQSTAGGERNGGGGDRMELAVERGMDTERERKIEWGRGR